MELNDTAKEMEDGSKPQQLKVGSGLGGTSQAMIDQSGQARAHGPKKSTTGGARRLTIQDQIGQVKPYVAKAQPGQTGEALGAGKH